MRSSVALPTALALLPLLAACGQPEEVASAPAGVATQYSTLEAEVAERGATVTSGEWQVSTIVEAAEPWFETHGAHHRLRPPAAGETHHLEIIPVEKRTGRIVPDVPITLEVLDASGRVVQAKELDFYYGTFFHYATNFSVPRPGTYTLRATLGAPTFLRHGEQGETPALSTGATVTFDDVELTTD